MRHERRIASEWEDFDPVLPYRDANGKWHVPRFAQRRRVLIGGKLRWEKRPCPQTVEEWDFWNVW